MRALSAAGGGRCASVALAIVIAIGCTATQEPAPTPTTGAVDLVAPTTPDVASESAETPISGTDIQAGAPASEALGPTVTIAGVAFGAELATTPALRAAGLSGRDRLAPQTGMLFIWETELATSFWMRGVRFPLDFVWISKDCVVVDITPNVPAPSPETPSGELPSYRSGVSAAYTFEINAGETQNHAIAVGAPVRFNDIPTGEGPPCS